MDEPTNYNGMYVPGDSFDTPPAEETPTDTETPIDSEVLVVDTTDTSEKPVVDEKPIHEKPMDSEKTHVLVNVPALNVRESDDLDSEVVVVVKKDKRLKVIDDTSDEWLFVEVDGKIGYVKKTFTVSE